MIAVIAAVAVIAIIAMIVVCVVGVVGVVCAVIAITVMFLIIAIDATIAGIVGIVFVVVIAVIVVVGQQIQKVLFLQELEVGKSKQRVTLLAIKRKSFVAVSLELLKSSRQELKKFMEMMSMQLHTRSGLNELMIIGEINEFKRLVLD